MKTTYQYDDWGRQHKTILPDGQEVTQTTNWFNGSEPQHALYYQETSQAGSPDTKNYYDRLGRTLREETEVYGGKTNYSQTTYNAKGQVTSEFASLYDGETEHTTFYTYKNNGRLDTKTLPTGKSIEYEYGLTDDIRAKYYIKQTVKLGEEYEDREYIKRYNQVDEMVYACDPGGYMRYDYHACGEIDKIEYEGQVAITMDYDECSNQTYLYDPDAGEMHYDYNTLGDLKMQRDAKGNEFWLFYDDYGRLQKKTTDAAGNNIIAAYTYVATGNGKGQVKTITGDPANGVTKAYEYDNYNRLKKSTETIQGEQFTGEYKYDDYGNIEEVKNSDELIIKNEYNDIGYLKWVKANETKVWERNNLSSKYNDYTYGNGIKSFNSYDEYGFPTNIVNGGVSRWDYSFNELTGNLESRSDYTGGYLNIKEGFSYDKTDRLLEVKKDGDIVLEMEYSYHNNMYKKSDVGNMVYPQVTNDDKPHAIRKIDNLNPALQELPDHEIDYTPFNKVSHISEPVNNKDMYFMYGPEYNRKKVDYYKNDNLQYTRYYSGNCEKTTFANGDERKVYYISGGDGLAAAWVKENGQANLYYIHTDHLGSICAITDEGQNVVANYSFDAWGNRRDPDTWELTDTRDESFTARGFTGHEHIDEFGLINMNGRVYDPTIGQFLSPDNYVQLPDYSLGFNRYSYCLNNPLIYTDPSGEFIFSLILPGVGTVLDAMCWGAVIGAGTSAAVYATTTAITGAEWSGKAFWNSVAFGALGGALGGGLGAIGTHLGAFGQTLGYNMLSNVASNTATSLAFGNDITAGGLAGMVAGGFIGAGIGGFTGVKGSAFKNIVAEMGYNTAKGAITGGVGGMIGAAIEGEDDIGRAFLQGAKTGAIAGATRTGLNIAALGATMKPENASTRFGIDDKAMGIGRASMPVYRRGGVVSWFTPGIAIGRNLMVAQRYKKYGKWYNEALAHERAHYYQQIEMGFGNFYERVLNEYLIDPGYANDPYSNPATLDYWANQYMYLTP